MVCLGVACLGLMPVVLPAAPLGAAAEQDAAPDIKKLAQAKVTAAQKAFGSADQRLKKNLPGANPEDVHTWSIRWLDAQRELSSKPADHIAALNDHLKRMQELAKIVHQLVNAGAPGLHGGSASAADFYIAEAELWLAKAKVSAKQAEK